MEEGPSLKLDAVTQGLRSHTGCDMRSGHQGELCAHLELSAGQGGRLALEVAAHHTQRLQGPKASARTQKSPDTPGSPEGNTEGPGTASSEPLLPS